MFRLTISKSIVEDFADIHSPDLLARIAAAKNRYHASGKRNCICDWFYNAYDNVDAVKTLLMADFNEQKRILEKMRDCASAGNPNWRNTGLLKLITRKEYMEFKAQIMDVFVTNGYDRLNKGDFVKTLNLRVCPYCGRSYVYAVEKPKKDGGQSTVKHQIDHFLNKDRFPMFAMSFYNLIPSCVVCNMSPCKGQQNVFINDNLDTAIMHPYEFDNDLFKFRVRLVNSDYFKDSSYDITTVSPNGNYKNGYDHFFAIGPLYKQHSLEAKYLWMRKRKWNKSSLDYVKRHGVSEGFINMFFRAFFSFSRSGKTDKDLMLSKFYKDIFGQLK